MWKAPNRPKHEITQAFNDGLVTICTVCDALLEGKQYRIDTVQKVMDIYPPCVDLALAKIEQEFEVMA